MMFPGRFLNNVKQKKGFEDFHGYAITEGNFQTIAT